MGRPRKPPPPEQPASPLLRIAERHGMMLLPTAIGTLPIPPTVAVPVDLDGSAGGRRRKNTTGKGNA